MSYEHRAEAAARRVLVDPQCRCIIEYFRASEDDCATVGDIAEYVQAGVSRSPTTSEREVAISLYHSKLPLMAETSAFTFSPENNTVRYAGDAELESLLETAARLDEL